MKKLVVALTAVLLFTPAVSVQALALTEYLDQAVYAAPQQQEEVQAQLDTELLPVFKTMAKKLFEDQNVDADWAKVDAFMDRYVDSMDEKKLGELIHQEMAKMFDENTAAYIPEALTELKAEDEDAYKATCKLFLLGKALTDFNEQGKLRQTEILLINNSFQERLLAAAKDVFGLMLEEDYF